MPATERLRHSCGSGSIPSVSPGPITYPQPESVVVILGVMCPSILPQPSENDAGLDPALPSSCFDANRQREDVILYDPLSYSIDSGASGPASREKLKASGYADRVEAQRILACDLLLLSLQRAGRQGLDNFLPP